MAKMLMGSCDGCGTTTDLGEYAGCPLAWYSIWRPSRGRPGEDRQLWACSVGCLVDVAVRHYGEVEEPYAWNFVPMTTSTSRIVHAAPMGRQHAFSVCNLVNVEALVPASGEGLRPCKRCEVIAERLEPGWYSPSVAELPATG